MVLLSGSCNVVLSRGDSGPLYWSVSGNGDFGRCNSASRSSSMTARSSLVVELESDTYPSPCLWLLPVLVIVVVFLHRDLRCCHLSRPAARTADFPFELEEGRGGTNAENARVTSWHWRVEGDDWLRL
ncbi:hypothetical protein NP493_17g02037 [Ridgeia piscesae]|uniref:Uncharacterized protein n=1 Tax=Ridgeia piscesae TaxID=27915 RepID=A0AAD9UKN9_RIDPI|nr:hypothetical protein NP493_17g02037 [Ridgeia piscesae]